MTKNNFTFLTIFAVLASPIILGECGSFGISHIDVDSHYIAFNDQLNQRWEVNFEFRNHDCHDEIQMCITSPNGRTRYSIRKTDEADDTACFNLKNDFLQDLEELKVLNSFNND